MPRWGLYVVKESFYVSSRVRCAIGLVLFTVSLNLCGAQQSLPSANSDPSEIAATVGSREITADMLRNEIIRRGGQQREPVADASTKTAALDALIRLELLATVAIEVGLEKDPGIIEAYKRLLAEKYWRDHLQYLGGQTRVSDQEVRDYYDAYRDQHREPIRARAAIIFLRYPASVSEDDKTRLRHTAERVLAEANSLPPAERFFGNLAGKYSSDSASARRQGDIGWILQGASISQWEPVAVNALFALDTPGQISPVTAGDRGIYLVRLVDRTGGAEKPLQAVEREISEQLYREKTKAAQERFIEQLKQRYPVSINEDVLGHIWSGTDTKGLGNAPPAFPVGRP